MYTGLKITVNTFLRLVAIIQVKQTKELFPLLIYVDITGFDCLLWYDIWLNINYLKTDWITWPVCSRPDTEIE